MNEFAHWADRKLLRYVGQLADLHRQFVREGDARAAQVGQRLEAIRSELRTRRERQELGGES